MSVTYRSAPGPRRRARRAARQLTLNERIARIRHHNQRGMLLPREYREALERLDPLAWSLARQADREDAARRAAG